MDPRSLDEIHRFTASVEQPDLFEYLDLEKDADKDTVLHAIQVRRSWAQGQQANPKFRQEALWVIKNISLITSALTTEADAYTKDLRQRIEQEKLETLSIFINGMLAQGELTAAAEEAIQQQGEALGLVESTVIRRIGEILAEQDAKSFEVDEPPAIGGVAELDQETDLYAILDTPPDSDPDTLEQAYRKRYRWARQLQDRNKSSRVYALLDEAWRVLKDPEKRAEYDQERAQLQPGDTTPTQQRMGLLPPPPPTKGLALPMPTVERRLEQIESGVDLDQAPVIDMPFAQSEREAPPPPQIPPHDEPDLPIGVNNPSGLESAEAFSPMPSTGHEEEIPDLSIDDDDSEAIVLNPSMLQDMPSGLEGMELEGLMTSSKPPPDASADHCASNISDAGFGDLQSLGGMMGMEHTSPSASNRADETADLGPSFPAPDGLVDMGFGAQQEPEQPIGSKTEEDTDDQDTDKGFLSVGQMFNDRALLKIDGPRTIRIRTGAHPFPVRITVINDGEGPMPGRVSANVDWVQLSPKQLDPNRTTQVIEALVEPDGMPSNSAKAVVTVDTDHGETRTVTIDALKHVVSPVMMFVAALSLIGLVGVFLGLYFSGIIGSEMQAPVRTILAINVDPPAGEVFIDDQLVGKQGTLSLVDSFPIGEPFQVRIELDGFEPYLKEVTVPSGTQFRLEADLILRDAVDFTPEEGLARATIDEDAMETAIEQRKNSINACFTRNLRTTTPFKAEVSVTSIVTSRGAIEGIVFGDANFRSPAVELCLRRQLRAIHLPLLAGDYAEYTRVFGAEIRPVSVLNEDATP